MFNPKRVFIERDALKYEMGERLYHHFQDSNTEVHLLESHNRVSGKPGDTPFETYDEAKRTLVIGVRKTWAFSTCKPSAHYQLPLVTSCIGRCEYCYLNTQLGSKPYIRIYVNIDEILERAEEYIEERKSEITLFEAAATSDPLPVEGYTHALEKSIVFFAGQEYGRLRFVTKFTDVEPLLSIKHNNHTTVRFSVNAEEVIQKYEHHTPSMQNRIRAAAKIAQVGYSMGFIIAPVILYDGWKEGYINLLQEIQAALPGDVPTPTFEVISHRFTSRAKSTILRIFPDSTVPMDEEKRKFKYGQFGYGKYVYPDDEMSRIKEFFQENILQRMFPQAEVLYII